MKKVKNFDTIAADYAFFETHATEAEQDLKAILPYLEPLVGRVDPFHFLDFGCGTGTFTDRLFKNLKPDKSQLHLTLVEPGTDNLEKAVERLRSFSRHPLQYSSTLLRSLSPQFDLVLANHVLYYVTDLKSTLSDLLFSLAPAGRLIINMAGMDNSLIQFWQAGFAAIEEPVPYAIAGDVIAVLQELDRPFHQEKVYYTIRFPDTEANRLKISRFLFGAHLHGIPESFLMEWFEPFSSGGYIRIDTVHSLFIVSPDR